MNSETITIVPPPLDALGMQALAAKDYLKRKWRPIPLPYKSKACKISEWQKYVADESNLTPAFSGPCNVGVLLGASGLTDVDIDSPHAALFAGWLPATNALWGRPGNPKSHYLYQDERPTRPFKNSHGMVIEIRSHGSYAVVPPSVHPEGDAYVWETEGEPGTGEDLEAAVKKIAIAATLLPAWKEGNRHNLALAVAGLLFKADWPLEAVSGLVLEVAKAAGDAELVDRVTAVQTTHENISKGAPIAGISTLIELLGEQDANAVATWVKGEGGDPGARARSAKSAQEKREAAIDIRNDLKVRGVFYRTNEAKELLFFHKKESALYELESPEFRALCCEMYGINGKEPIWGFVQEDVVTHCRRHGEQTEFFRFARYQHEKLYIHAGGERVFRLDGAKVEEVDNGDDGILFRSDPSLLPIHPNYAFVGSPVREHVVDVANATNKSSLDLLECHIYTMFFEELLPTRPIVLFTGPKGSGKTSAGRALKRALHGPKTNVDTGMAGKEDAFWAAICHRSLVCIDNVDTLVPWLADALAVVATGGRFKRRKLYETNTLIEYVPRTFVMITSRNPQSFTRDDVADRLLLIDVERRKDFTEESYLLERLDQQRPQIWGELLTNLNKMVAELKKPIVKPPLAHRLADWARLAIRFAPLLGISDMKQKLEAMETSKVEFALDDHPVAQGIEAWVAANPHHEFIASGELYQEINHMYETKGQKWGVKDASAFGTQLKNLRPELETRYKIEMKPGHGNKKLFRFIGLSENGNGKAQDQTSNTIATQL